MHGEHYWMRGCSAVKNDKMVSGKKLYFKTIHSFMTLDFFFHADDNVIIIVIQWLDDFCYNTYACMNVLLSLHISKLFVILTLITLDVQVGSLWLMFEVAEIKHFSEEADVLFILSKYILRNDNKNGRARVVYNKWNSAGLRITWPRVRAPLQPSVMSLCKILSLNCLIDLSVINGSQLAKLKKSIPDMALPWNL